jgi:hypothetical protein
MNSESLKPCPACGKAAGELSKPKPRALPVSRPVARLRLDNDSVKLEAAAVKLWHEAKRESKKSERARNEEA